MMNLNTNENVIIFQRIEYHYVGNKCIGCITQLVIYLDHLVHYIMMVGRQWLTAFSVYCHKQLGILIINRHIIQFDNFMNNI